MRDDHAFCVIVTRSSIRNKLNCRKFFWPSLCLMPNMRATQGWICLRPTIGQILRFHTPRFIEFISIAALALAAPLIAITIHSECVFRRGIRLYQCEVLQLARYPDNWVGVGLPFLITFLLLLGVRSRSSLRWAFWICAVVVWTCLSFKAEVAIR
jgi:hypothetical protein